MVAYSFKARFAEPIPAGTKAQTIRADRKRHARQGEQLQLYTGMRTKHCRLITSATCESVTPVRLCFSPLGAAEHFEVGGTYMSPEAMLRLAIADGFASVEDMAAFWFENHGRGVNEINFQGFLIRWTPLRTAEVAHA